MWCGVLCVGAEHLGVGVGPGAGRTRPLKSCIHTPLCLWPLSGAHVTDAVWKKPWEFRNGCDMGVGVVCSSGREHRAWDEQLRTACSREQGTWDAVEREMGLRGLWNTLAYMGLMDGGHILPTPMQVFSYFDVSQIHVAHFSRSMWIWKLQHKWLCLMNDPEDESSCGGEGSFRSKWARDPSVPSKVWETRKTDSAASLKVLSPDLKKKRRLAACGAFL